MCEDNARASGMITNRLSDRQDLVEGLDTDGIWTYLSHHGFLDNEVFADLDEKATNTQRNSAILGHIEQQGSPAVSLLVSALRHSWQLQLASSLDTERRIRPSTGNSYLGSERLKGQLTIRLEPEALKIVVPREDQPDRNTVPLQFKSTVQLARGPQDFADSIHVTDDGHNRDGTSEIHSRESTGEVHNRDSKDDRHNRYSRGVVHGKDRTSGLGSRNGTGWIHSRNNEDGEYNNVENVYSRGGTAVIFNMDDSGGINRDGTDACDKPGDVHNRNSSDEEDIVKPKSVWCFCLSFRRNSKSHSKKNKGKPKMHHTSSANKDQIHPLEVNKKIPDAKQSKEKQKKKNSKGKKKRVKDSVPEMTMDSQKDHSMTEERHFRTNSSKVSDKYLISDATDGFSAIQTQEPKHVPRAVTIFESEKAKTRSRAVPECADSIVEHSQLKSSQHPQLLRNEAYGRVHEKSTAKTQVSLPGSEKWYSSTVKYEHKLEQIKFGENSQRSFPMNQPDSTCLQWKSDGQHFLQKASQLCDRVCTELKTDVIKYFEQIRGTLILDLFSSNGAVCIVSICMAQSHAKCLQQDIHNGSLLRKIEDMFSSIDTAILGIQGAKLRLSLDDHELFMVLAELS